jgi:hypothetical protein
MRLWITTDFDVEIICQSAGKWDEMLNVQAFM